MKRKIPTWLPIFSGFYDNWMWEPDLEREAEYIEEQYGHKDNDLWEKFDYQKWRLDICKNLCDLMEEFLSEFITKIHFEHLKSPREYNFETDAINCAITIKPKAIREYLYKHREEFDKHLRERYTSRDGFISWHSNNFSDWESETDGFKDLSHKHKCGAILNFIAINEDIKEEDLYERMRDRNELEAGEYFEEGFWSRLRDLGPAEFIRENYTNLNLLSLLYQNFDPKKWNLEDIMIKTMGEIESHTLSLKFK